MKPILVEKSFITVAREIKGMTQIELAEAVQVTQPTISYIERGVKMPSFNLALKISRVLDLDINLFVQEREKNLSNNIA